MIAPDAVVAPGGILRGDLVLVGGGDPFFGDESAAQLAQAIQAAGIRTIAGSVVGDESAFDGRRSVCCTGYDPDLGGVLSALAYDRGIFQGAPARRGALRRRPLRRQLKAVGVTRPARASPVPPRRARRRSRSSRRCRSGRWPASSTCPRTTSPPRCS